MNLRYFYLKIIFLKINNMFILNLYILYLKSSSYVTTISVFEELSLLTKLKFLEIDLSYLIKYLIYTYKFEYNLF